MQTINKYNLEGRFISLYLHDETKGYHLLADDYIECMDAKHLTLPTKFLRESYYYSDDNNIVDYCNSLGDECENIHIQYKNGDILIIEEDINVHTSREDNIHPKLDVSEGIILFDDDYIFNSKHSILFRDYSEMVVEELFKRDIIDEYDFDLRFYLDNKVSIPRICDAILQLNENMDRLINLIKVAVYSPEVQDLMYYDIMEDESKNYFLRCCYNEPFSLKYFFIYFYERTISVKWDIVEAECKG